MSTADIGIPVRKVVDLEEGGLRQLSASSRSVLTTDTYSELLRASWRFLASSSRRVARVWAGLVPPMNEGANLASALAILWGGSGGAGGGGGASMLPRLGEDMTTTVTVCGS